MSLAVATGVVFAGLFYAKSAETGRGSGVAASVEAARLIPFGPSLGGPSPRAKACFWSAELLTWTLVGGLYALALRESGRHGVRATAWVVALAGGLSMAIEAIQVVIPGRDVDLTSVVLAHWRLGLSGAAAVHAIGGREMLACSITGGPLDLGRGCIADSLEPAGIQMARSAILATGNDRSFLVVFR